MPRSPRRRRRNIANWYNFVGLPNLGRPTALSAHRHHGMLCANQNVQKVKKTPRNVAFQGVLMVTRWRERCERCRWQVKRAERMAAVGRWKGVLSPHPDAGHRNSNSFPFPAMPGLKVPLRQAAAGGAHPRRILLFESPSFQKKKRKLPNGIFLFLVTRWRFELQTHCLKGNCSAN